MANTDKFRRVGKPGTATTLSAPGHTIAGTSITVGSTTNWPTTTGVTFAIDRVTVSGSTETQVAGSYTLWVGDVTGATTIANMTLHSDSPNSDQDYSAGSTTRVYIPVSTATHNDMVTGILVEHNQDGTHDEALITSRTEDTTPDPDADFVLTYDASATALKKAKISNLNGSATGWINDSLPAVSSVTNNGNRSYDVVFASTVASLLSPGMRIRTTRTVTAPTQCADFESGSSQFYAKASPNKLTFTDDWTAMGWIKLESYVAGGIIARRNGSTEGWSLAVNASGQVVSGSYRIAANNSITTSYQSVPLGKWVHVAATTDLSGTSVLIYIDGVLVPSATVITGTITALVQGTTNLVVGAESSSGGNPFDGKIAQAAVFDAVLSASTIRSYSSQTLSGSETNLKSAYSFNGVITDLNTTTPNDLTAQNGVLATNVDSPFAVDGSGVPQGTTDYALVMKVSTTTATVQVPEGCTIPTSGGVSAVAYSTTANPFGWVADRGRWEVLCLLKSNVYQAAVTSTVTYNPGGMYIIKPAGKFAYSHDFVANLTGNTDAAKSTDYMLSTSSSAFSTGTERRSYVITYGITDVQRLNTNVNPFVLDETTQTTYYPLFNGGGGGTLTNLGFIATSSPAHLVLTPTGL